MMHHSVISCLFALCSIHNISVSHNHNGEGLFIRLRRTFGDDEVVQWGQMWEEIELVSPSVSENLNIVSWALDFWHPLYNKIIFYVGYIDVDLMFIFLSR